MNSFLELHSSEDYLNSNRPYYTGTWEPIIVASDYLIPFQYVNTSSDFAIFSIDADGNEVNQTSHFVSSTVNGNWNDSGSGLTSSGNTVISWTAGAGDTITSDEFALTGGAAAKIEVDTSAYDTPVNYVLSLRKGVIVLYSVTLASFTNPVYFDIDTTGLDYTLRIACGPGGSVTTNNPSVKESEIHKSGSIEWYNGTQLGGYIVPTIYKLKIVGSSTYYSDWLDRCGFDGKLKYKLSSEFNYGGIVYTVDYDQWIYKNASVRRSPRGEIDQIGTQRNGVLILEKSVSAVRYLMKMKVTEAEYEAFVHSVGGTVEITDQTGKVYNATNIEISDPTWHRSNGLLEISFTDENNISIWTKNN
jgi:hypothetical protein